MKTIRFISTFAMLALATVVTAGSLYVTVNAAAQQEADGVILSENVPVASNAGVQEDPVSELIAPEPPKTLAPDAISSDRSTSVALDANGGFSGHLHSLRTPNGTAVPAANYTVKVLQKGAIAATTQTSADGAFAFSGLQPGVAGLVGYNANGLMIIGLNLTASDTAGSAPVEIEAAVIEGPDAAAAMHMVRTSLSDRDVRFAGSLTEDDAEFKLATGEPATTLAAHRVQLKKDGTLQGTISVLDERTGRNREVLDLTVYVLRDAKIVGSARVNNDGTFIVVGLLPGVHSVVATGQDGVLASSVDILSSTYEAVTGEEFSPVSILLELGFSGSAVGPANLNDGNADEVFDGDQPGDGEGDSAEAPPAQQAAANPAGGGTGGGSGGGSGGGGGGLGALGLAGLAGLAGLNDDNDGPSSPGK